MAPFETKDFPEHGKYEKISEHSAILYCANGLHEGKRSAFDVRVNQQTLCNCLMALAVGEINDASKWTPNDLHAILLLGDKNFVHLSKFGSVNWPLITDRKLLFGIYQLSVVASQQLCVLYAPVEEPVDVIVEIEDAGDNTMVSAEVVIPDNNIEATNGSIEPIMDELPAADVNEIPLKRHTQSMLISSESTVSQRQTIRSVESVPAELEVVEERTLKEILDSWNTLNGGAMAILESPILTVALWKSNNGLWFMYDPRACDAEGHFSAARMEQIRVDFLSLEQDKKIIRQTDDNDENAWSCVIQFQTVSALLEHILSKVPEAMAKCVSFKFVNINLVMHSGRKSSSSTQKLHPESGSGASILRASLAQDDSIFPNRNRQDAANCVTALAFSQMCPTEDWTPLILDVILKYGDRLYTKSLHNKPPGHAADSEKLSLNQIIPTFILANSKFELTELEPYWNGPKTSLLTELIQFFASPCEHVGVIVVGTEMVAIWKSNEYFYLFDPHEAGPEGYRELNGVACLMRFDNYSKLTEMICSNFESSNVPSNHVQLMRVKITNTELPSKKGVDPMKFDQFLFDVNSPSLAYVGCDEMKTLHGSINEASPTLRWNNLKQTACHMVAAIAMSSDLDSEYWTSQTIDQILYLGTDIFAATIKGFKEQPSAATGSELLHPQQVVKNFPMSDQLVHIEMELFQKGIVNDRRNPKVSLKIALAKLFANKEYFVAATIETAGRIAAIWRQRNIFYAFFSCSIDTLGLCTGTECAGVDKASGKAAVLRIKSASNLYRALMLNIPKADESGWFEIRRCDVTLSPVRRSTATKQLTKCGKVKTRSTVKKCPCKIGWKKDCNKNAILVGSNMCMSSEDDESAKSLTNVMCAVAIALSTIQYIHDWNKKTLDVISRTARQLYNDTSSLHGTNQIEMCHMPREFFIGESSLFLKIPSPIVLDVHRDALMDFFDAYPTSYITVTNHAMAIIRVGEVYFLFDPIMNVSKQSNYSAGVQIVNSCVVKLDNFQRLLHYFETEYCLAVPNVVDERLKLFVGSILCFRL